MPERRTARFDAYLTDALIERRTDLDKAKPAIEGALRILDDAGNLSLHQACGFFAVTMHFHPDLIIELGRGEGNSTATFALAGSLLHPSPRIVSYDLHNKWETAVRALKPVISEAALRSVDIRVENICSADFAALIGDARRVLVLWDAHGFDIADKVLSGIMPILAERDHLVLMHDITDSRYCGFERSYKGGSIWRATYDLDENRETRHITIGWVNTIVDQAIPTMDFLRRNDAELHSADLQINTALEHGDPTVAALVENGTVARRNHWAFFSLNEAPGPYHFPTPSRRASREIFRKS